MIKLNTICVDDELPALRLIENYCKEEDDIAFLKSFTDPQEALKFSAANKIDLIISDIQMPYVNGLELLQQLAQKPMCIFVTADPSKAVTAYELDVIDYLVKPVSSERFKKAIHKAVDYKSFLRQADEARGFIMFKSDYRINKISLADVSWVEGMGEYIKIITPHKKFTTLQRLSDFENQYKHLGFVRIHKSYLVLKQAITAIKANAVVLSNGASLPVGRVYKANLISEGLI